MKLSTCFAAFFSALIPLTVAVAAGEDTGSDTLTNDEARIIAEERKVDLGNEERTKMWLDTESIDIVKKTAALTNNDRHRKAEFLEKVTVDDGSGQPGMYPMINQVGCDMQKNPPKVKIDIALVKDTSKGNAIPAWDVFTGLQAACQVGDEYKSWVQRLKTIHFHLAKNKPLELKFDPATRTLHVGMWFIDNGNIDVQVQNWVKQQR